MRVERRRYGQMVVRRNGRARVAESWEILVFFETGTELSSLRFLGTRRHVEARLRASSAPPPGEPTYRAEAPVRILRAHGATFVANPGPSNRKTRKLRRSALFHAGGGRRFRVFSARRRDLIMDLARAQGELHHGVDRDAFEAASDELGGFLLQHEKNVAWARTRPSDWVIPLLRYRLKDLRARLADEQRIHDQLEEWHREEGGLHERLARRGEGDEPGGSLEELLDARLAAGDLAREERDRILSDERFGPIVGFVADGVTVRRAIARAKVAILRERVLLLELEELHRERRRRRA